jgi:hypothetical protein
MKAKLIKKDDDYFLEVEYWPPKYKCPKVIGNTFQKPDGDIYNLSKQNCDEIFGVVDVEKLADEFIEQHKFASSHIADITSFRCGFNKAMELNKDKVFTLEDVMLAWDAGVMSKSIVDANWMGNIKDVKLEEHKKFYRTEMEYLVQQPTEIEVEIEMVCPHPEDTYRCGLQYGCDSDGCNHPNKIPYLDSLGNLILKKI